MLFDEEVSYSKLLGSFCGALTTTPGLASTSELENILVEEATLGYGCSYLFGVIATVLTVQIIGRKSKGVYMDEECNSITNQAAIGGLIQIGLAVVLGRFIGNIHIGAFSLGNSGEILCAGIILGAIIQMLFPQRIASMKSKGNYRNLGLILFFAGNGVPAGMSFHNEFDVKIIVYGAIMTVIPIAVGIIVCRIIDRENGIASVVAGGMTSTPAIGVLMQRQCHISLSRYSLAYVGALVTVITLIRLCE